MKYLLLIIAVIAITGCTRMSPQEMKEQMSECTELDFGFIIRTNLWTLEQDLVQCCYESTGSTNCDKTLLINKGSL